MSSEKPFSIITTERHQRLKHLPFVPSIRVRAASDLIFVSGILGTSEDMQSPTGPIPPGDIAIEAERVFTRMAALLALSGATLGDVVRITKYMTDLNQHDAVVAVMRRHFGDHLPTSTTIEVRRLVPVGFGLEVDAIAAVQPKD